MIINSKGDRHKVGISLDEANRDRDISTCGAVGAEITPTARILGGSLFTLLVFKQIWLTVRLLSGDEVH